MSLIALIFGRYLPQQKQQRTLVLLKSAYLFFYIAQGALEPFLPVLFTKRGYSVAETGLLVSLQPFAVCLSAPLSTWFSDALGSHGNSALLASILASFCSPILYFFTPKDVSESNSSILLPLIATVLLAFVRAPIPPLLDTAAMKALRDSPSRYGELRLWGAIGFGLSAFCVGFLVDSLGEGTSFVVYSICVVIAGLILRFVSKTTTNSIILTASAEQNASKLNAKGLISQLKDLLQSPGMSRFLAIVFMMGITHSVVNHFVPVLLTKTLSAPSSTVGVALALAVISEVPAFLISKNIADPVVLVNTAHIATIIRMSVYLCCIFVFGDGAGKKWKWSFSLALALSAQLLHGATFSCMWSATVVAVNALAPPSLTATAQGVVSAVYIGISAALGSVIGGILFSLGPAVLFAATATIAACSLMVFLQMPSIPRTPPSFLVDPESEHASV